ncbi:MAG: hypothetical protein JO255_10610 [Alphaproteobacteria bacterium]|nr:hypothetical protein [Alphaproteobacteria bacterium]
MSKHLGNCDEHDPKSKDDCGCGCHGAGDCNDAEPSKKARRALLAGAGSVAFVATLMNRRAFAAECGPVSHAASLHHSGSTGSTSCVGHSPGFWKNHAGCVSSVLGSNPSSTTLGTILTNLNSIDSASASTTFKTALCNPNADAYHWAAAILDAMSSTTLNPNYGYTLNSLNAAIKKASQAGLSSTTIVDALKTLESDGLSAGGCTQSSLC